MDEIPINQHSHVPPPHRSGRNPDTLRTAALRRVRHLESTAAKCSDPWMNLSRLVVADLFRTTLDRQDGVRNILIGGGTAAQRLDGAQDQIGLLLASSRRVTKLLTIEIERGPRSAT
jgi:hypothetical protein